MTDRITAATADAVFQTETPLAWCVRADDGGEDIWLPKSRARVDPTGGGTLLPDQLVRGAACTVSAPEALLIEKGLV